jgi:hypothetical protein
MVMPILGGSTTTVYASGGSITYSHVVSMERADGGLNWPTFGANNTGSPYTYDGSQTSVLTLGRSSMKRESKIDQTSSNFYAAQGSVAGDYMINAEDTAGMLNIQPNEPEQMCDSEGFLAGSGATGSYPVSESYDGKTGVIIHGGGVYESEVGLNDGDVHLSGASDIVTKGYLYGNVHSVSMKGFDKNSTGLNAVTTEDINYKGGTALNGTEEEFHGYFKQDYATATTAYDELIEELEEKQESVITSISADRVNESVENSTIEYEEPVNLTANQTHGESKGLEEISGQSIIRD